MSLFKNKWFSKLTGKGKQEQAEKEAAELAAKEQAEKDAAELAAKEQAEKEAAQETAKEEAEDYVFKSWFARLGAGLSKTSSIIGSGIAKALTSKKLDDEALEQIEENLIIADVGAKSANELGALLHPSLVIAFHLVFSLS